ncbi:MAG: flagellar biosynthetic protein FliQ [Nannocystaceae bacterium]
MLDAAESVREGIVLAFWCVAPIAATAVVASVVIGALGARVGLRDPQVTAIARAIAVVVALLLIGATIAGGVADFGRELWGGALVEASG